ncbi:hypothetical protein JG688_00001490 [Phytophthora aleatoria]|uniref:DDE-1 domain-containing protein n=1 Tax=Phytophthora aleatoria TaxID=2496075 RepID=A0A8J5J6L3_9STRA|nr:hypothetical protein JG688_00001490 [Phytophthora aleatoria]
MSPAEELSRTSCRHTRKGMFIQLKKRAWMDTSMWQFYLRSLLYWHISEPSVLLVDNLDCRVSAEAAEIIADEMLTFLQHLPKNSTSVCQPLDVGVMGPFTKLKELWMLERPPPLKNGEKRPKRTAKQKRMETIKRAITACESIEPKPIVKVFNKALLIIF